MRPSFENGNDPLRRGHGAIPRFRFPANDNLRFSGAAQFATTFQLKRFRAGRPCESGARPVGAERCVKAYSMFQTLGGLLSPDSRALQLLVGAVVLLIVLAVIYGFYRLVFAHRLRVPGAGRGRAPRLGVVDVFGLDGQRQIVIVRRDNIEHLLMIGGPNDLLIESQILRSSGNGANSREPAKASVAAGETALETPAPPASPAPIPRPVAPAPRRSPLRAETSAPPAAAAPPPEPAAPVVAPEFRARPAPAPRPVMEIAPKPAAEPTALAPPLPKPREPVPVAEPKSPPEIAPPRKPPTPAPTPTPRAGLPAPITPLRPRQAAPEVSVEPTRPASAAKAPDVIIAPPPQSVADPGPTTPEKRPRKDEAFYDLESLEAEMARLLGRDP